MAMDDAPLLRTRTPVIRHKPTFHSPQIQLSFATDPAVIRHRSSCHSSQIQLSFVTKPPAIRRFAYVMYNINLYSNIHKNCI